jgi:hypothetical protein
MALAMLAGYATWEAAKSLGSAGATAKEALYQFNKLREEVEDAKVFLSAIKNFIDEALKSKLNICALNDLIDSVNAFQQTFKNTFLIASGPSGVATKGFQMAWAAWYRAELAWAMASVEFAIQKYQIEFAAYQSAALEVLLSGEDDSNKTTEVDPAEVIAEIKRQLRKKNSQCQRIAEFFKSKYATQPWDTCKECGDRSIDADLPTPSERWAKERKKKESK